MKIKFVLFERTLEMIKELNQEVRYGKTVEDVPL